MTLESRSPEEAGLDEGRLDKAYRLLAAWADSGEVPASAVAVARNGVLLEPRAFGRHRSGEETRPLSADAVFLVASVTKPVTATAAMQLVEAGKLTLGCEKPCREHCSGEN